MSATQGAAAPPVAGAGARSTAPTGGSAGAGARTSVLVVPGLGFWLGPTGVASMGSAVLAAGGSPAGAVTLEGGRKSEGVEPSQGLQRPQLASQVPGPMYGWVQLSGWNDSCADTAPCIRADAARALAAGSGVIRF